MTAARDLVVIGGGEHARVLMEAALTRPDAWRLRGFVDPLPCEETTRRLGVPWLGDDQSLTGHGDALFVVGLGGPPDRRRSLVNRHRSAAIQWAVVIHASATVSPTCSLGPGCVVLAGAVVNTGAGLGEHCIVNSAAIVEHDVRLGAFTHAAPGSVVGGGAVIGEETHLGLGCRVRDHIEIGDRVTVGMGAVVVSRVGPGATVLGVPARSK